MSYLVAIAVGLVVVVLFFALLEERKRQHAERRLALVASYYSTGQYNPPPLRAVESIREALERFLEWSTDSSYLLRKLSERLSFANLKIHPLSFVFLGLAFLVIVNAILDFIGLPPGLIFPLTSFLIPAAIIFWVERRVSTNRRRFQTQLPEFLMLIASSINSGLSVMQAIDTVSSRGGGEIERQFRRLIKEVSLGQHLETALENLANRSKSEDMLLVVAAIQVQRETGGNLSGILTRVADSARERAALEQQIRVLSSEGRFSAAFLTLLPLAVFGYFVIFNPDYVSVLWTEPVGLILSAVFFALIIVGAIWMRILVRGAR